MSRHTLKASVRITCPPSDVYRYFSRIALDRGEDDDDVIDERLRQVDDQLRQWGSATVDDEHGQWTFKPPKQIDWVSTDVEPSRAIHFTFRDDGGLTMVDQRLEMDFKGLQDILMWITSPFMNLSLRGEMRTHRDNLERDYSENRDTKDA